MLLILWAQVRLSKERKKGDKIVSDSQERAFWRVYRPPPGCLSSLEVVPVPTRFRPGLPRPPSRKRTLTDLQREVSTRYSRFFIHRPLDIYRISRRPFRHLFRDSTRPRFSFVSRWLFYGTVWHARGSRSRLRLKIWNHTSKRTWNTIRCLYSRNLPIHGSPTITRFGNWTAPCEWFSSEISCAATKMPLHR